ncbi:MAG: MFS transporter [Gammaproteobacteria bacterium]|nr:MFS transporter [Gammaproteobacteria bacterium]
MDSKKFYSWVLYDWANSAYATIVLAGFFPIIFAEYFATSVLPSERTLYLGISNSVASLILIFIAPIFGLLSDKFSNKKLFLLIFASLSISSTLILSLIAKDSYVLASIFFSISLLGFMMSNVFYDSMLLNFESHEYDKISSTGYAVGYLGGGIAFVFTLVFLYSNSDSSIEIISSNKIAFVFAALWWLLFMIPLIIYWIEKPNHQIQTTNIIDTFKEIKLNKPILFFLISYWIYIDGVDTIIRMAINYGLILGFTNYDLLVALLVTQFVAFPGTLIINKISELSSVTTTISGCLIMYLIITLLSYSLDSIYEFYLIACLIGFVQGGIQALSRSYFAHLIPNNKHSEYFGIYNMLGKFAALIGPLLVGFVTYASNNARLGILSISIFFIIGLIMFYKSLNYKKI